MFSTRLDHFLPFSSNLKLSSANFFSLKESKICRLVIGKCKAIASDNISAIYYRCIIIYKSNGCFLPPNQVFPLSNNLHLVFQKKILDISSVMSKILSLRSSSTSRKSSNSSLTNSSARDPTSTEGGIERFMSKLIQLKFLNLGNN